MEERKTAVIDRALMRRGSEVLRFRYDIAHSSIVGKVDIVDRSQLPIGTFELDGSFTRPLLEKWITDRAVPFDRIQAAADELGFESSSELMLSTLGLSLSDQYWFRPLDSDIDWRSVNPFENDFDTVLGQALVPDDDDSASKAISVIEGNPTVIYSSPDPACGGNLPKYWDIDENGTRRLYKSGKTENGIMEPYNEEIATRLCALLLDQDDFVPSRLEEDTVFPRVFSSCPCMIDARTELVPAHAVMKLAPHDNSMSLYQKFIAVCKQNGLRDVEVSVEKMLLVDHILSNFDRHWSNFGIIRDVETNAWVRVAPLFDMGESLWCDRMQSLSLRPYKFKYSMPFSHKPGFQFARYCDDLSWFDPSRLSDFPEIACDIVELNPFAMVNAGFIDLVHKGLTTTIDQVTEAVRNSLSEGFHL